MQIQLKNLGPIHSFEFDLEKHWIVLFGPNNVGKSYAISVVYLILKHWLTLRQYITGERHLTLAQNPQLALQQWLQEEFLKSLQDSCCATFEDVTQMPNRWSRQPLQIHISTKVAQITIGLTDRKLVVEQIRWSESFSDTDTLLSHLGKEFTITQVHYLPATRFGLYQSLSAILANKVEIPSLSTPASDYLLGLSNPVKKHAKPGNPDILEIVAQLERTILKGEIIFDESLKKFVYRPDDLDVAWEISFTSSLVSELFPLVAYLKYIVAFAPATALSTSLLFIEEPEAHLHPQAQVQLLEILAKLVKAKVKLVMVSHSDAMFIKMSNLVIGSKIHLASTQAMVFKETKAGSIATEMPANQFGIDDENFLNSAESLYQEKLELIEALN